MPINSFSLKPILDSSSIMIKLKGIIGNILFKNQPFKINACACSFLEYIFRQRLAINIDAVTMDYFFLNPNCAKIFIHLIHETYKTPPLSPVIAVIKGQTKKKIIKFCKKTNFEQFFNGFYCYLMVKLPKTCN